MTRVTALHSAAAAGISSGGVAIDGVRLHQVECVLRKGPRHEQMEQKNTELKIIGSKAPIFNCDIKCMRTYLHVGQFNCYKITGMDNQVLK